MIVALDVASSAQAQNLVAAIGNSVRTFKIGKQLFTAEGPRVVRDLVASGRRVFLDLKFHDIPTTVAGAVREAARLGVSMLTVHASGGRRMLQAAVEAANSADRPPLILAVTVLTSLRDEDMEEIGIAGNLVSQVLRLAALARRAGCGGVVTSAREARAVRATLGAGFAIVTPGVRLAGESEDDQGRVVTPAEAIRAGATHIVVGRPITKSADPAAIASKIVEEIAAAG
ncbi:MAG TPA: orotidine-5'-phosphate decarboxylase [Terriglobales bacterium]|nr:orotidine-5'-phosphate decarboxylase [Terriglobales bacterium]